MIFYSLTPTITIYHTTSTGYREEKIETLGDVKVDISLPNLPNGVYILEATTAQNRKTVKLVRMNNRP